MSNLTEQRCVACEGIGAALTMERITPLLAKLHADWSLRPENKAIQRQFKFNNFHETMAFVNAIAWIAHTQNHHPDLQVGYNTCQVVYTTHALNGLSQNDFICAAKIDQLV